MAASLLFDRLKIQRRIAEFAEDLVGLEFKYTHSLRLSLQCLLGIYYPNAVKGFWLAQHEGLYYSKGPGQSPHHPTTHLGLLRETRRCRL